MNKDYVQPNKLNDECKAFCHYLINQRPNEYVLEKYEEAHRVSYVYHNLDSAYFDNLLVWIASLSPFLTRLADAYTRVFFRGSVLRKKLVLLLAILESCAPTYSYFDAPDSFGSTGSFMGMLKGGLVFAFALFLSTLLFAPLHIVFAVGSGFSSPLRKFAKGFINLLYEK